MRSLNFIGGEKGGVGKSVAARVLAQYFIDRERPFVGFDTDRSHTTFTRFYADYASPVVVDSYEGLDAIASAFEDASDDSAQPSVIVDLAAQTAAPLARWIQDSDLLALFGEMGIAVNFWHIADAGKDSVDLLGKLVDTFGAGPNYFVVKNLGRGHDLGHEVSSLRPVMSSGTIRTQPSRHGVRCHGRTSSCSSCSCSAHSPTARACPFTSTLRPVWFR